MYGTTVVVCQVSTSIQCSTVVLAYSALPIRTTVLDPITLDPVRLNENAVQDGSFTSDLWFSSNLILSPAPPFHNSHIILQTYITMYISIDTTKSMIVISVSTTPLLIN
jgi:hypothetical protein